LFQTNPRGVEEAERPCWRTGVYWF